MPEFNPSEAFRKLLKICIEKKASDLHISSDADVRLRIHGELKILEDHQYSANQVHQMVMSALNESRQQLFDEYKTLDVSVELDGYRFRANFYREKEKTAAAIRRLENDTQSFESLHLPEKLSELSQMKDGLILITGPTGSGKSTTLATIIDQINTTRACHILTIEDPIEYIHQNKKSLVHQRECHKDFQTFSQAVRSALREDPDVILVGEMRDRETMQTAITAAETGHLVLSTLHTPDAPGAIDRISGMFPETEQEAVRKQLSMVLRVVVAQRLVPTKDGQGVIPCNEILWVNSAISHLIRIWNPQQIYSYMETGQAEGMMTMEQSLTKSVAAGLITEEQALRYARDPGTIERLLKSDNKFSRPESKRAEAKETSDENFEDAWKNL